MSAFKQHLKKIKTIDCSGLTSVTQDGIFHTGKCYLILGDSFYLSTATHMLFTLRYSGSDDTGASYQRGNHIAQHGGTNIGIFPDNASPNGGTINYCGDQPVESTGFKIYYQSTSFSQTSSFLSQSIGHVNGTGYRGDEQYWTKLVVRKFDGFKITFNGFTATSGNLNIYEYNLQESEYIDNV